LKINAITLLRGNLVLANQVGRNVPDGINRHVMVAPTGFDWVGAIAGPAFQTSAKPGTLEHSQAKCDFIAGLYNEHLRDLTEDADAVLIWEDDIKPPGDGLSKLATALSNLGNNVGAVVSAYPQYGDPERACLWGRPYDESMAMTDLPEFPFEVFRGGTGFALFDARALRSALPLTRDREGVDWCLPLARKLADLGWKTYCHGAVRCAHLDT
jgi:hypothetical protein